MSGEMTPVAPAPHHEPLTLSVVHDDAHLLATLRSVLSRWLAGARWPCEEAERIVTAANEAVTATVLAARAGADGGGPTVIRVDGAVVLSDPGPTVEVTVTGERSGPAPGGRGDEITHGDEITLSGGPGGPPHRGVDGDVLAVVRALMPVVVLRRTARGEGLVLRSAPLRP